MLILISTCISINLILYLMYLSLDTNLSASARNIVFFEYFRSFYTFRVTFIKCRLSQYSRNSEYTKRLFLLVSRRIFIQSIELLSWTILNRILNHIPLDMLVPLNVLNKFWKRTLKKKIYIYIYFFLKHK